MKAAGTEQVWLHRGAWIAIDIAAMVLAGAFAGVLLGRMPDPLGWLLLAIQLAVRMAVLWRAGTYRNQSRFTGLPALINLVVGLVLGTAVVATIGFFTFGFGAGGLGRAFLVVEIGTSFALMGGARLLRRMQYERARSQGAPRALIYGAGVLGETTLRGLQATGYRVVGFIDDDSRKKGTVIHGRKVHGDLDELGDILQRHRADLLVLAVKDLPAERTRAAFNAGMQHGLRVTAVRGPDQVVAEPGRLELQDLAMEDLIGRRRRHLDPQPVRELLADRVVLVTGAGGSIGSEIARQCVAAGASRVVLLDSSEFALYAIHTELVDRAGSDAVVPVLHDCTDVAGMEAVMRRHGVVVCFHAAAYKHVPLVEANPSGGLANNLGATRALLQAAEASGVQRFVLISSDKAVAPSSVMGASKRACELMVQAHRGTLRACAVRFGNVLGSSGSVVPRFLQQIHDGGPVTVTDERMTRYFMLIPEAVALVLQAGALSEPGAIAILDMGEPVRIDHIARQLIYQAGLVPDQDIAITYTGLRPGEKLHEVLVHEDAAVSGPIDGVSTIPGPTQPPVENDAIDQLIEAATRGSDAEALARLAEVVPDWTPDPHTHQRMTAASS